MVKVRWSRRIIAEIHEAREYLLPYAPASAERLTNEIFAKGVLLEQQPLLGRVVPEAKRPEVRELFYKKYRVVYRLVSDSEILMLTLHPALRPLVVDALSGE
ncbi:type II toxin-antitoxin system RelE/ParE family toxin [Hymenobacter ruricola]|uniref:Type II toxin-antitoxin system RelE/ParE family toxin n=1 Tax=Hymenobacter ruricola TaxID=2791023 RepID=A0ABS0HYY2_9BACT|nr:type II toxin-antitoxin system RelE/ParE family toxin [Hymenobacter ruricola]MBF9219911.1 type II toxin-antitoxin system RelE/ParE family toxin [Hymenobacter ruricola]